MKCSIIQDLLPLYCDDMASEDSRKEIEKHLAECETCREVLDNMKIKEMNINIPEKDISPFKTIKKKNRIKLICAVLSTAVWLFGVFMFAFWGLIPIKSDRVHYTVSASDSEMVVYHEEQLGENGSEVWTEEVPCKEVEFEFTTDSVSCRFRTESDHIETPENSRVSHQHLYIYPKLKLPFDDDSNSFMIGNGTVREGDTLTIHYRDREETIDLYQLYLDNVKE